MKKHILTAILLSNALLTSCSSERALDAPPPDSGAESLSVSAGATEEPEEITGDNMERSILLFDKISAEHENSMFSPLSLNMALGLLEAGASGGSEKELEEYLGTDSYADFAERYMKKISESCNSRIKYDDEIYFYNRLEIANSFWADNTLPLNPEYKETVTEKFGAEVRNLDLGDKKKSLKTINDWISEKTYKLIPSALSDYDNDIPAILVNTVYFESRWQNEWNVDASDKQTFTLPDGSVKEFPLMRNGLREYYENEAATAFGAGYENGMRFIGILPKKVGDFTLSELDIPSLLESVTYDYDVSARMPRLDFETNIPLSGALRKVGIKDIFSADKAELSGISEQPLYVSDIMQKTRLELDEYGTKAAAVSTIYVGVGTAQGKRKKRGLP